MEEIYKAGLRKQYGAERSEGHFILFSWTQDSSWRAPAYSASLSCWAQESCVKQVLWEEIVDPTPSGLLAPSNTGGCVLVYACTLPNSGLNPKAMGTAHLHHIFQANFVQ